MSTGTFELVLLGRFSVHADGRELPPDAWKRRRGAEVVKILALARERRLHREQLMHALWPELSPQAAAANLRKAVHYARRALGSADSLKNDTGMIELLPGADVSIDAVTFESAARTSLSSSDRKLAGAASELYAGELLPDDRYSPWADEPRERLRQLAIRVMKLASRWEQVIDIDPADEDAHRALMQRALDAGDRTRAIRQFEQLRERLRIDLGAGPDRDTVSLYEQAVAGLDVGESAGEQQVRGLLARAFVEMNSGQMDAAERNADRARRLAVANGLAIEFNEATAMLSIMSSLRNRWRDLFRSEFADALLGSDQTAARIFDAHLCVTEYHLHGPSGLDGLAEYAAELAKAAEESGSLRARAVSELLAGEALLFAGEFRAAEPHLTASVRLHEGADAAGAGVVAIQRLAECALARGETERARQMLGEGLRRARLSPLAPHLVTRMHEGLVRCADAGDARRAIQFAKIELDQRMNCPACSAGFWVESARKLVELGEADLARTYLERADGIAAMWPDGAWHAAVIELRGLVARSAGDDPAATELLLEAAERFAAVGRLADEARCRLTAGASQGAVSA